MTPAARIRRAIAKGRRIDALVRQLRPFEARVRELAGPAGTRVELDPEEFRDMLLLAKELAWLGLGQDTRGAAVMEVAAPHGFIYVHPRLSPRQQEGTPCAA